MAFRFIVKFAAEGTTVIPCFRNRKTFSDNGFISGTIKSGLCLLLFDLSFSVKHVDDFIKTTMAGAFS
jgi:hypothetical protein